MLWNQPAREYSQPTRECTTVALPNFKSCIKPYPQWSTGTCTFAKLTIISSWPVSTLLCTETTPLDMVSGGLQLEHKTSFTYALYAGSASRMKMVCCHVSGANFLLLHVYCSRAVIPEPSSFQKVMTCSRMRQPTCDCILLVGL